MPSRKRSPFAPVSSAWPGPLRRSSPPPGAGVRGRRAASATLAAFALVSLAQSQTSRPALPAPPRDAPPREAAIPPAASGPAAAAAPPASWSTTVPGGVEWTAPLGEGDDALILLATSRDPELRLIRARDGRQMLNPPVRVLPGIRPAVTNPGCAGAAASPAGRDARPPLAYAYDRWTLYAIETAATPRLRWKSGDGPPPDRFPDDPEYLPGWLDAAAVRSGIAAVDSRGRFALFAAADGSQRWSLRPGARQPLRLLPAGDRLALTWSQNGNCRVLFVDAATGESSAAPDPGIEWPVSVCFDGQRLVLSGVNRLVVLPFAVEAAPPARSAAPTAPHP